MLRTLHLFLVMLFATTGVKAADFFIDPAQGTMNNDGSATAPWRSLQDVIQAGLVESRSWGTLPHRSDSTLVPSHPGAPIRAGDRIWLRTGDYGDLVIKDHYNTDFITIAAADGHTPRFRTIHLQSSSHWVLRGLQVSPEFGSGKLPRSLIHLASHDWAGPIHDIVVENCRIRSAADTSSWSAEDWNARSCTGIEADGTRIILRHNQLKNVNFGLSVSASHSLIESNVVENFAGDGMRGLGDHSVFQYNRVKNCYDVNGNHDDGFQSWSQGPDGVGTGQVVGMVLRGNTIINYEDPAQPHRGSLQGIGCFDGMFVDWIIENNVVIADTWHGITLLGARACRIVNNTVIDLDRDRPGPPWISIEKHKDGRPPTDCVVRNNLTTALRVYDGDRMRVDGNVIVKDLSLVFVNAQRHDLRLQTGCDAIDAGNWELAPTRDITGTARPQGNAVDVGAYERPTEPQA